MLRTLASILAAVLLAGCVAPTTAEFENYRVVEFVSLLGVTSTKLETWDRVAGWKTGGILLSVETLGHSSVASSLAGPAVGIYAADRLGDDIRVSTSSSASAKTDKHPGDRKRWK